MTKYKIGIIYLNTLITILEVTAPSECKASDAAFQWVEKSNRCKLSEHVELYYFGNPRHDILFSNVVGL